MLSLPDYYQVAVNLGLVAASYAIQRAKIENTKFEKGGKLKSVINYGGIFDDPSHRNGGIKISNAEVEGKEGYVINKSSMASGKRMTVTGTPAQISSAANVVGGGIDFAPGASRFMYEYGGSLGMNLNAPVLLPRANQSSNSMSESSKMYDLIMAQTIALQSVNERIDNLSVGLNPNLVTNYQKNKQKAVNLSRL